MCTYTYRAAYIPALPGTSSAGCCLTNIEQSVQPDDVLLDEARRLARHIGCDREAVDSIVIGAWTEQGELTSRLDRDRAAESLRMLKPLTALEMASLAQQLVDLLRDYLPAAGVQDKKVHDLIAAFGVAAATFPPELEDDRISRERFGQRASAEGLLERRIVWNLLRHLKARGFEPLRVDDGGDEPESTPDALSVMNAVFAVDEARIYVHKPGTTERANLASNKRCKVVHWIDVILGNGQDCISDYGMNEATGFSQAMDAFDAEQFVG